MGDEGTAPISLHGPLSEVGLPAAETVSMETDCAADQHLLGDCSGIEGRGWGRGRGRGRDWGKGHH